MQLRPGSRGGNHSRLDLPVAVRAHEHALARLLEVSRERLPETHLDLERLGRGIDVVEVQIAEAPGIAADPAAAAELVHQQALELAMTARDRLADAALAPVAPACALLVLV